MIIYGTALLAACHLLGAYIGDLLGIAIGVKANVGGVGIAMILLISVRHWMRQHGLMTQMTEDGVAFWSLMYIPVVVAMAAQQNVMAALRGGPVAVIAALGSVLLCAGTVALINRLGPQDPDESWKESTAKESHA